MKNCPFCQVENRDDAEHCRFCGRAMNPPPARLPWEETPEPTQPVRATGRQAAAPRGEDATQPGPAHPPAPPPVEWSQAGGAVPDAGRTQPRPPSYPYSGQGYGAPPPAAQGGYGSLPPEPPSLGAQIYTQPHPSRPRSSSDRPWYVLAGVLGLLLLCVGGMAVWVLTSSAAGGLGRAGAGLATQAAGLFGPANTPLPSATPTLAAPTPWPTFTTAPTFTAQPSATPAPTEAAANPEPTQPFTLERYLSPECAGALDRLEALTKAVTEQPGLPLQAEWRAGLGEAVAGVRAQCGTLEQASPVPGQLSQVQENINQATQAFDDANRLFKEGLDTFTPSKVVEAGQRLAEAIGYFNRALGELRRIGQ